MRSDDEFADISSSVFSDADSDKLRAARFALALAVGAVAFVVSCCVVSHLI